jgi:hypothetical protein
VCVQGPGQDRGEGTCPCSHAGHACLGGRCPCMAALAAPDGLDTLSNPVRPSAVKIYRSHCPTAWDPGTPKRDSSLNVSVEPPLSSIVSSSEPAAARLPQENLPPKSAARMKCGRESPTGRLFVDQLECHPTLATLKELQPRPVGFLPKRSTAAWTLSALNHFSLPGSSPRNTCSRTSFFRF